MIENFSIDTTLTSIEAIIASGAAIYLAHAKVKASGVDIKKTFP